MYIDLKYCRLGNNFASRRERIEESQSFHMTFRYIDCTLSIDHPLWDEVNRLDSENGVWSMYRIMG